MPPDDFALKQNLLPTHLHEGVHKLYHHHHGWLSGWLRKRVGCHEAAAELAQDTFLRLLVKTPPLSVKEGSGARRYLRTVADGLCIDMWRRKSIEQAWLETLAARPQVVEASLETRALVIETLCEIDTMLGRLPANVASAFIMSQVEGLTYKKIAEELGVSDRMVKKYMARAMLECVLIEAQFIKSAS